MKFSLQNEDWKQMFGSIESTRPQSPAIQKLKADSVVSGTGNVAGGGSGSAMPATTVVAVPISMSQVQMSSEARMSAPLIQQARTERPVIQGKYRCQARQGCLPL